MKRSLLRFLLVALVAAVANAPAVAEKQNPPEWVFQHTSTPMSAETRLRQANHLDSFQGCVAQPAGLISWWPGEGNANDAGDGNNGLAQGNLAFAPGEVGQAFDLNGADAGVVVPNSAALNFAEGTSFSIDAWIKANPGVAKAYQAVVDKRNAPDVYQAVGYTLFLYSGHLSLQLADAPLTPNGFSNFHSGGPDLRDGQFHHVAAVVDRTTSGAGRLYVDGQVVLAFDTLAEPGDLGNSDPLWIGIHATAGFDFFFSGAIDEVHLFNRALSADEVQSIAAAGSAGVCQVGSTLPDFVVTAIEVTQAIQDLDNSVPLVAGKRTYARVYVRNAGAPTTAKVTARLCGPARCMSPDNSGRRIQIPANPDRAKLDDSFYFELPPEWLAGDITLSAEVNPAGFMHVPESTATNNTLGRSVSFQVVPPLKVTLFGVHYKTSASSSTWYDPRPEDYALIRSWLKRAYPVAEVISATGVITLETFLPSASTLGPCTTVNIQLQEFWNRDFPNQTIDTNGTRYYGIVSDAGGLMRGCAPVPSSVASGPAGAPATSPWPWDKDASYGDWYAGHELGHAYGRSHANFCTATGGAAYPYPDGKISPADGSMYGFDIESRAIYTPTGWTDVMTYCDYEWISDFTYNGIRDYLVAHSALAAQYVQRTSTGEHLIVLGTVNYTQNSAEFQTMYRLSDVTAPDPPVSGTHHLKLLGAGDAIIADYPFTPGKTTDTLAGEDETGMINETVPWVAGTQRVAVYSDTLELASRLVSPNAPTVTLIAPNGGEVFTDSAMVSWSASDPDGDSLTYALQYSADDGTTWQTVAVDVTDTTVYPLDLRLLPGSELARVRVFADDGVNSGMDASDGTFRVAGKPPQASIVSPHTGGSFLSEQTIVLVSEGTDIEDGTLGHAALSWQSSLGGDLGSGRMLAVTGLPGGTQTITLTATDSRGNDSSAEAVVTILVEPTGVALAGPSAGLMTTVQAFTAAVVPVSATLPITYTWQATGQTPVTHTAGLSDTAAFTWGVSGTQTITVTAGNETGFEVTNVYICEVSARAVDSVSLDGPAAGLVNAPRSFTAEISSTDATLPVTYVWQAARQTITHTAGLSDTAAFAWGVAGTQAITVTADNGYGAPVSATHTITLTAYEQRVNSGGPKYTDPSGKVWAADRAYTAGGWGYVGGSAKSTTSAIAGTTDDPLYKKDRTWTASAQPGYRFTVPDGGYEVTLKFAETIKTAAGQRKFGVKLEGTQVLTNFDIFKTAGAKNRAAADQTFIVNVADGELSIDFVKVTDNPKVNAIQVRQLTAYELRVNAGGVKYTDKAGKVWQSDKPWAAGQWGYVGGVIKTTTAAIAGTLDDPLYRSDRTWSTGGAPGYRFAVPNGRYEVTLKFAETVKTAAGQRKFGVKLESATVLSNYDIYVAAGNRKNKAAPDQVFTVDVTDGELRLDFVRGVDMPKLNAIQVKWLNP